MVHCFLNIWSNKRTHPNERRYGQRPPCCHSWRHSRWQRNGPQTNQLSRRIFTHNLGNSPIAGSCNRKCFVTDLVCETDVQLMWTVWLQGNVSSEREILSCSCSVSVWCWRCCWWSAGMLQPDPAGALTLCPVLDAVQCTSRAAWWRYVFTWLHYYLSHSYSI